MSKGRCTPSAESVVTSMAFFLLASAIMAASILLLHKVAAFFGCRVKYKALALSAVLAFLVNFVSIRFTPYLTQARYVCLFVFIVITSLGATIYNAKLLRRERRRELQDGLHAFEEHAAKSQEAPSVILSEVEAEKETLPVAETPSETLPVEMESTTELVKDEANKKAKTETPIKEPPARLDDESSSANTAHDEAKPLQRDALEKESTEDNVTKPEPIAKAKDEPKQVISDVKPQVESTKAETTAIKTPIPAPVASTSKPETTKEPAPVVSPKVDADTKETTAKVAPPVESAPAKDKPTREATPEAKATPSPTNTTAKVAQKEVATPAMSNVPPKKATIDVKPKRAETTKATDEDAFNQALQQQTTLDGILNLAFAEKEQNHLAHAERAYREALRRYRQDPYAPFIVTEWGNVCKEMGNLALAAVAFDSARALPAVQNDVGMQKAFAENARYLRAVDAVLKAKGLRNVPFHEIDPALLREAEAKMHA